MEALCDFLVYSIQRILVHSKALGNNVQSASHPSVERSLINNGEGFRDSLYQIP